MKKTMRGVIGVIDRGETGEESRVLCCSCMLLLLGTIIAERRKESAAACYCCCLSCCCPCCRMKKKEKLKKKAEEEGKENRAMMLYCGGCCHCCYCYGYAGEEGEFQLLGGRREEEGQLAAARETELKRRGAEKQKGSCSVAIAVIGGAAVMAAERGRRTRAMLCFVMKTLGNCCCFELLVWL